MPYGIPFLQPQFYRPRQNAGVLPPSFLDLDPSLIVGLGDGDPVATLPDGSGNGRDATQASSSFQPTYQTNELNGEPIVRFDGVDDTMSGSWSDLSAWTAFMVLVPRSLADYNIIFSAVVDPANRQIYFDYRGGNSGLLATAVGGTFYTLSASRTVNVPVIEEASFGSGTLNYYNTGGSTAGAVPTGVASYRVGSFSSLYGNFDLARILIYDSVLSSPDRGLVRSYLQARFGI